MIGIIWPLAALFNFINAILWLMHNIIMISVTKIRKLLTKWVTEKEI